jgi:hypothetical protein
VLLEYTLDHPDTSGTTVGIWADVRDTANIHILALEHPDAAGERVLIGSGESLVTFPGSIPSGTDCTNASIVQRHSRGKMSTTYSTASDFRT